MARGTVEVGCRSGRNPTSGDRQLRPFTHCRASVCHATECINKAERYKRGPIYISPYARLRQELTFVEHLTRCHTHKPLVFAAHKRPPIPKETIRCHRLEIQGAAAPHPPPTPPNKNDRQNVCTTLAGGLQSVRQLLTPTYRAIRFTSDVSSFPPPSLSRHPLVHSLAQFFLRLLWVEIAASASAPSFSVSLMRAPKIFSVCPCPGTADVNVRRELVGEAEVGSAVAD